MVLKKDNAPVTAEERDWYFEEEYKENRTYKDTVFVDLFYDDETAKQNLLSLYNALHDTDYHDEKMIQKIKVESILYKNFYNDISFALGGKMLIFGEHQSSVNNNMPLRCLMYSGRVYEQAVLECIQKDILADYLRRKGSEVINMLIAEYDYEMDMEVAYEEAYEEATEKITKDITEKVTKDVTKKVTKDVTEKVTKDVTEKVTKDLTEKVTEDTVALSGKIFQSIKHNPEFTDYQISEDVGCDVEMVMKVRKAFMI